MARGSTKTSIDIERDLYLSLATQAQEENTTVPRLVDRRLRGMQGPGAQLRALQQELEEVKRRLDSQPGGRRRRTA